MMPCIYKPPYGWHTHAYIRTYVLLNETNITIILFLLNVIIFSSTNNKKKNNKHTLTLQNTYGCLNGTLLNYKLENKKKKKQKEKEYKNCYKKCQ